MCSYHKVGGRFVYDADKREELGGDEKNSHHLGDDDHVHSLQKGLKESSRPLNSPRSTNRLVPGAPNSEIL